MQHLISRQLLAVFLGAYPDMLLPAFDMKR